MAQFPPKGFAPEPTVMQGGLARMIRCWESCRDANDGGYGGGVVQLLECWNWTKAKIKRQVTSCSPFTATVIGMVFDQSGTEAHGTSFQPKYDGGTKLIPSAFYAMHNGFYLNDDKRKRHRALGLSTDCNSSAESLVFFNLGYEIDPKDMRRGDLVGINWNNRGGHATFCWDVHLNAAGEVDCFLFLSSNGRIGKGGPGVSVGVRFKKLALFVKQSGGAWKKQRDPLFADCPEYVTYGNWLALPGVKQQDVDLTTFKGTPPSRVTAEGGYAVGSLRVVRLWGVAPPTRPQTNPKYEAKLELARRLAQEDPPASYATGSGTPVSVHVKDVPATKVPAKEAQRPEAVKQVPPKPAEQPRERVVDHQLFVEQALHELHAAGWIDRSPGKVDSVYDAETKAAVEDFQTKFHVEPIDGKPGRITRTALKKVIADLHAGKPNPNKPEEHKPRVDHFYWLKNRVPPGGRIKLALHGANLHNITSLRVTLTCEASGKQEQLSLPRIPEHARATFPLEIPASFEKGTSVVAHLQGQGKDGTAIDESSGVPLYLDDPIVSAPVT